MKKQEIKFSTVVLPKKKKASKGLSAHVETIFQSSAKTTRKLAPNKQRRYTVDLRIQTPQSRGITNLGTLSPAPALIRLAKAKKLDCIAVADFFSGRSIDSLERAARDADVKVLPAMSLRIQMGNCNDITLLCLFVEGTTTDQVQQLIMQLGIPDSAQGDGSFILRKDFKEIVRVVEAFGGVIVPSRVDKTPSSQAQVSDLIDHGFRAFDLAYAESVTWFRSRWPEKQFRFFSFSNATAFAQVGSRAARIQLPELSFDALSFVIKRDAISGSTEPVSVST